MNASKLFQTRLLNTRENLNKANALLEDTAVASNDALEHLNLSLQRDAAKVALLSNDILASSVDLSLKLSQSNEANLTKLNEVFSATDRLTEELKILNRDPDRSIHVIASELKEVQAELDNCSEQNLVDKFNALITKHSRRLSIYDKVKVIDAKTPMQAQNVAKASIAVALGALLGGDNEI